MLFGTFGLEWKFDVAAGDGLVDIRSCRAILISMGDQMEAALGPAGRYTLYLGFWGAVATSLLGVWQGIPYMFADFVALVRRAQGPARDAIVAQTSPYYRGFLLFLALPTQLALLLEQPVSIVLI